MIVWAASFPRSGNTFLRLVLSRMVPSWRHATVYSGEPYMPMLPTYRRDQAIEGDWFLKSHRQSDATSFWSAIYVVRDGLEAIASLARQQHQTGIERLRSMPQDRLVDELIEGTIVPNVKWPRDAWDWRASVLAWTGRPQHRRTSVVRFADLVDDPITTVADALCSLDIQHTTDIEVPALSELRSVDARFFDGTVPWQGVVTQGQADRFSERNADLIEWTQSCSNAPIR